MQIQIRPFQPSDRTFILSLVPRFIEKITTLPGRAPIQIIASLERPLCDFMTEPDPADALFVAETSNGIRLGFVFLQTKIDAFTMEPQGHISDIAVTAEAEGQGVGRALMAIAETWARQHHYRLLTLNAFAHNRKVRDWYERQGFKSEMVRYGKLL